MKTPSCILFAVTTRCLKNLPHKMLCTRLSVMCQLSITSIKITSVIIACNPIENCPPMVSAPSSFRFSPELTDIINWFALSDRAMDADRAIIARTTNRPTFILLQSVSLPCPRSCPNYIKSAQMRPTRKRTKIPKYDSVNFSVGRQAASVSSVVKTSPRAPHRFSATKHTETAYGGHRRRCEITVRTNSFLRHTRHFFFCVLVVKSWLNQSPPFRRITVRTKNSKTQKLTVAKAITPRPPNVRPCQGRRGERGWRPSTCGYSTSRQPRKAPLRLPVPPT